MGQTGFVYRFWTFSHKIKEIHRVKVSDIDAFCDQWVTFIHTIIISFVTTFGRLFYSSFV